MSKGKSREPQKLGDISELPITASINKASQLTGLSWQTIRELVNSNKVKGIKVSEDSSKIMISMYSLIKYLDGPIEALEKIWMDKQKTA